uniref:hypothetical chloroplast RF1 n=1 Tax=Aspidopterys concava TaxID=2907390 RepID=UPI001EE00C89|nr:hypothetical chloroplast RF1 [Aspidopterys concava]UIB40527.1 hypothetical chloroplast RF1 [Aspidopterys concava]
MIFKSFILGNLVSLCMKIINSVVVVGLYYGFLTTFSMGPSYLFLLRARVIEEGEEGTEKKVSATTGFITGQLVMFISIYYAPLHLALGRPHTITVLALPYLLFHFFWNNHKHFFDYGSTTRNSMRNLSIQCVFLNNLIFQLFNHFILPSSMLVRLVNIYMFRCNNKILFVTSSFVGWLIGHILFMKWVGLILVWIQQNQSIRTNVLIRSNKYLVLELRNSMARIFSILLFITCVYSLGRMPSPIFTKKLKETSETEEREESEEERDVEIETTSETKGTKQEQEGSTEEDPSSSLFSEEKEDPDKIDERGESRVNGKEKTKDEFHFHFKETCYKTVYETFYLDGNQENSKLEILIDKKDKDLFWFEKPLVTILFDYKRWNRPFRYIKNDQFENAVRREMSQYFFYTCQSDGKERISFTYPPGLETFLEMMQKKISPFTTEKLFSDELYNHWNYNNEQKKKNVSDEFLNRIEALDERSRVMNTVEKSIRLCTYESKKEYLPKLSDPSLSGSYRGKRKIYFLPSILNEISKKSDIEINKFILFILNNQVSLNNQESTCEIINRNLTKIGFFFNLININENECTRKSTSNFHFKRLSLFPEQKQEKMNSKNRIKILKFLLDAIITEPKNKTIIKNSTGIKEIRKQVPRWPYELIDDLEQQEGENDENVAEDHEIRSRKAKRVLIFTNNQEDTNTYNNPQDRANPDPGDEVALIRYSQQSDFRRDIIKGSMRAQRRKTAILKMFQANAHSPLFLDRVDKSLFFSFDISEVIKRMFLNWMWKNNEFTILDSSSTEQKRKEEKRDEKKREEKNRIEIAEAWDSILLAQVIRGCLLVTQSILRKYIVLPSLIIGKNIIRILLFQFPEWSQDFKDWGREMHVKCTYNGVQLSEREFPKNWLTDGIQIKILFPFRLKPWHRSKSKFPHKDPMKKKEKKNDFCFLTVLGMETELPFGSPRKRFSPFEPLLKKLERKIRKLKKNSFLVLTIFKKRIKFFLSFENFRKNSVMNLLKEIINKLPKPKSNPNNEIGFKEVYELDERQKEKDSIININNWMIQKPSTQTRSMDWINHSVTEKKMKDLTVRTKTIINQIEKITKEKKKSFRTSEISISPNKKKRNSNAKIKCKSSKSISKILKRRNVRLVRKFDFFIKILIEKIYIDIFLNMINIPKINTQPFLESRTKFHYNNKHISNNEENTPTIYKDKKKKIHLIKELFKNRNISFFKNNSQIFCDISSLSQAYVFYKLSQIQVIALHKLKSSLKYHGAYPFLKNEIKDYFEVQGLFYSDFKDTKLKNSAMNQWKNWLRNHYQYKYDFYQIKWPRLIPQKWRNRINQVCMVQNKDLNKWNLYEKDQLIHYKKKKNDKKQYRYDLLSYKSINYEDKKGSSSYKFPLEVNKISYNYNREKRKLFDMLGHIPIKNYLAEHNIINREKKPHRKYFDWRILSFCPKKKVDIESWIDSGTRSKINIKTKKYQTIDRIDNKDLFFLTIPQAQEVNSSNQKVFFDWMEMNEKIINHPISNFELWFFQKFWILCKAYKKKPWVIPIKLLLFNFNGNKDVSENQKINRKKNGDPLISRSSNEKKSIELENQKHEQKESEEQVDLESVLANQEKDLEEDYAESNTNMKKRKKKKKYKSNTEAELDFFLKRYLRFHLRWDDSLNQKIINNIKVYCLLLRLTNPREIMISSIQRGEISLDILMIHKDLTLTQLMKKGILLIEPIRLSVKNDGQFIMYQTISILLLHKSKQEINQRCRDKSYIEKKNLTESIERHRSLTINRDTNHYDLVVPENLLSPKRRRELRIRIFLNSKKRNAIHINTEIFNSNNIKKGIPIFDKSKDFDRDKKKLIKLKLFLWPNYRLEDLACMNRYWFDTNNGSRFSMVRIHIYPRD